MRLWLAELQELDEEARRIRAKGLNGYKELNRVLYHQGLSFIPEIIWTKLISWHHDNPLAEHFSIDKTKDLVGQKYYWPSLQRDIEAYVKGCDVCLGSKAVRHKPYGQGSPCLYRLIDGRTCWWILSRAISTDWKGDSYDSILVIVDRLTKMVYYEPVKVTIDAPGLAKVILDAVVWHHCLPNSIVSDRDSLFTSKF